MAENTASKVKEIIINELGIDPEKSQGRRRSWTTSEPIPSTRWSW